MATIIIRDRKTNNEVSRIDFPIQPHYQALTNKQFIVNFYNDAKRLLLQLSDDITYTIFSQGYDKNYMVRSEEIVINDKINLSDLFQVILR